MDEVSSFTMKLDFLQSFNINIECRCVHATFSIILVCVTIWGNSCSSGSGNKLALGWENSFWQTPKKCFVVHWADQPECYC